MSKIIMGLVNVYSPIQIDDLVAMIQDYFEDDYKKFITADIYGIINGLSDADMFYITKHREASLFSDEELEYLLSMPEIKALNYSNIMKDFENPEEILNYANVFEMKNNKALDELKDYIYSLDFKDKDDKEDAFHEAVVVIYKMYDENEFFKELNKRLNKKIDKEKLSELMYSFGADLPRGFLHGYTFKEVGEKIENLDEFSMFDKDKLDAPRNAKQFSVYSYEQCLYYADKLKETDIFDRFCSDNVIELYINGQPIFIQLLGYYNGDKNVIIYGNKQQFDYNYHFVIAEQEDYPDIMNRIEYSEVVLDTPQGFLTPEIELELVDKKLPDIPLIIDFDPVKGPVLSKNINLVGAVLESLLEIHKQLGDDMFERCEEGELYKIIQFYLHDNGVTIGEYSYLEKGDPVLPFKLNKPDSKNRKRNKNKKEIGFGLYSVSVTSEEDRTYLTLVYEYNNGIILAPIIKAETQMSDIVEEVIGILDDYDIEPTSFSFNNDFALETFDSLYDYYNLEYDPVFENYHMNELFGSMMDALLDDSNTVIH